MLEKALEWRKESKIDSILEESSLGEDLGTTFYMNGTDREGRPVCYNLLGAFRDEETYQRAFGSEEKKRDFLRWRVQLMEKGIEKLEFGPGKPSSFVQVIDLKDAPGLSKKEIRVAMKEVVELLQDNYPEFVAKNVSKFYQKKVLCINMKTKKDMLQGMQETTCAPGKYRIYHA